MVYGEYYGRVYEVYNKMQNTIHVSVLPCNKIFTLRLQEDNIQCSLQGDNTSITFCHTGLIYQYCGPAQKR